MDPLAKFINEAMPTFIKVIVLMFCGGAAFAKEYTPSVLRIIFLGIAIAMIAWLLAPYLL